MSINLSTQLPRTTDTGTRKHLYSAVRIHRLLVWHTWKQSRRCYFLGTFYDSKCHNCFTHFICVRCDIDHVCFSSVCVHLSHIMNQWLAKIFSENLNLNYKMMMTKTVINGHVIAYSRVTWINIFRQKQNGQRHVQIHGIVRKLFPYSFGTGICL